MSKNKIDSQISTTNHGVSVPELNMLCQNAIELTKALNQKFEKGYSVSTLTNIRKFYDVYKERISEPLVTNLLKEKLYLPDKKTLQNKLQEWLDDETKGENDEVTI